MANQTRDMTEGQKAYETRRAAKAGMTLEKWMQSKQRQQEQAARERQKAAAAASKPHKKPGLFARLLERAHKPL